MKQYKSHKIVKAAKIMAIDPCDDDKVILQTEDGMDNIIVSEQFMARHLPAVGGYYVSYPDGYYSYSPAGAFEEGYNQVVDSKSDERTVNNSEDQVRTNYRVLTDEEKQQMNRLKQIGQEFLDECDFAGKDRELSIAKTKAEEAVMWAVKSVTK